MAPLTTPGHGSVRFAHRPRPRAVGAHLGFAAGHVKLAPVSGLRLPFAKVVTFAPAPLHATTSHTPPASGSPPKHVSFAGHPAAAPWPPGGEHAHPQRPSASC